MGPWILLLSSTMLPQVLIELISCYQFPFRLAASPKYKGYFLHQPFPTKDVAAVAMDTAIWLCIDGHTVSPQEFGDTMWYSGSLNKYLSILPYEVYGVPAITHAGNNYEYLHVEFNAEIRQQIIHELNTFIVSQHDPDSHIVDMRCHISPNRLSIVSKWANSRGGTQSYIKLTSTDLPDTATGLRRLLGYQTVRLTSFAGVLYLQI
jgi:hypothetical protein